MKPVSWLRRRTMVLPLAERPVAVCSLLTICAPMLPVIGTLPILRLRSALT